jgi:hypothetical protein
MVNTNPKNIQRARQKRGPGRPRGAKDSKPRQRRIPSVTANQEILMGWKEAADSTGVPEGKLIRHAREIGVVKVDGRYVLRRSRILAWLDSLPSVNQTRHDGVARDRIGGNFPPAPIDSPPSRPGRRRAGREHRASP